jgi:hypothetical protein
MQRGDGKVELRGIDLRGIRAVNPLVTVEIIEGE